MKTATLLAFLLLGLACTYAVTAEEEISEDEPAEDELVAEDEMIEDDEDDENTEEDEEKRSRIPYRPCTICKNKKVYRKYYGKRVLFYCTQRCRCKGLCRYNRCYSHRFVCGKYLCSRRGYPKCPRY